MSEDELYDNEDLDIEDNEEGDYNEGI